MWTFAGTSIFRSVGRIGLTILLLNFGYGLFGVVGAGVIVEGISLLLSLMLIIKQIGFSIPSFKQMSEYLRYSLPIAPSGLVMWITDSSDRYIVGYFLGTISVGIYSAAYGLGNLVYLFVVPLQMILFPQISKLWDMGELSAVKLYLSYSLKFFLLISFPAVVGLTVLSKSILVLLTSPEFTSGYMIIPFVALSAVFSGIFQILSNVIFYFKETKFSLYIILVASLANIFINILFVPRIGYIAAAISTLLSFVIMTILCYRKMLKYINLKLNYIFFFKIILSSLFMGIIVYFIPLSNLFYQIILGIFIYFLFIILLKTFNRKEISYFISFIKKTSNGWGFFS